ncbi:MAG TPA: hypothetical protein VFR90_03265 [Methylibium sp.]|uniref:terminase gpP N-terminus-related DNA-binding protein n=1 Tax=Methylibium sp. TaxID=2067992 RepID=UPI002DBEA37E|nr:hypothetical protein [Methylibium sp.]HEU4458120.1 hypothetical protein [Methylibium sp.]
MTQHIRFVQSALNGYPVGGGHHRTRFSDHVVAEARALRLQGWTCESIGRHLEVNRSTVSNWVTGRRRTAQPIRVIVRGPPRRRPKPSRGGA